MLELLLSEDIWKDFFDYKCAEGALSAKERRELEQFLERKDYEPIVRGILSGSRAFSVPARHSLNKFGTGKKRIVYTYAPEETLVLKLLSRLLYRYDYLFADNCFSFRREVSPRSAFLRMTKIPGIDDLWCFKADISNYYNSIPAAQMVEVLRACITDDEPLTDFLAALLLDDRAMTAEGIVHEPKGVMAGVPISAFPANLYLRDMDYFFAEKDIHYARYADDIIMFGSREAVEECRDLFYELTEKKGLRVNREKTALIEPGCPWSFLGFSYERGTIDIAPAAVSKLMGRIRRAGRSLHRWKLAKNVEDARALRAMNRKFNRKFYGAKSDEAEGKELTWARWYFPIINTDRSLRLIDEYMQQYQRYIVTGKHNARSRGRVPYAVLRDCGYRPLTAAYYKRRESRISPEPADSVVVP